MSPRPGRFISSLLVVLSAAPCAAAVPPSFRNDVMAVLSKAGCNQGTCHGNQNGKNGFKLSLRGEDPNHDWTALSHDMLGRRGNPYRAEDSLILLKATAAVPHEGGRRFAYDTPEYDILRRWLASGMPKDPPGTPNLTKLSVTPAEQVLVEPARQTQLRVRATFSDGTERDVTRLAVFEPSNLLVSVTPDGLIERENWGEAAVLVRYLDQRALAQVAFVPARAAFRWQDRGEQNYIDRHVFAKLKTLRILPAPACSDAVFLRRAYLDALGILPTPVEARAFLQDSRPNRRALLIDALLERPEFADFWALKWSDVLHNEEKALDAKGVQVFHHWIRQCMAERKPLNEFARELIAARGSTYRQPAANFYRALRQPEARAEAVAQVFLGIRLQCAHCHNHPFERWTQNDYYSQVAFFSRIDYQILENNRTDRLDKHEFIGEQVVWQNRTGDQAHPRTGAPVPPRFLDGPAATSTADRLQAIADWVADPDNPFFARTQANRIWYHLLGRGIVEPNDDFRASNPPANPALLEALARDLAEHQFDLRHLVRTIMNSQTYQLAAATNETNTDDEANFARALIRPLQAEQLLDALAQVNGVPAQFNGYPKGVRSGALAGLRTVRRREGGRETPAERFLKQFGKPERFLSCDCERSDDTTLGRAFQLISGALMNDMLATPNNRLGTLLAQGRSNSEIVDELFLATLCREAAPKEKQAALGFLADRSDRRAALEDLLWGLLNSKEFLLRQ